MVRLSAMTCFADVLKNVCCQSSADVFAKLALKCVKPGVALLVGGLGIAMATPTPWSFSQAWADEVHYGQLTQTDEKLPSEAYYDLYHFETEPGQTLTVDMTSKVLDTYLALISPNNVYYVAADYRGAPEHTRFEMLDLVGGQWTIVASTQILREGQYVLDIKSPDTPHGQQLLDQVGQLSASTSEIQGVHLINTYRVPVKAGQRVLVDLSARKFDTVLKVKLPSAAGSGDGSQWLENDDYLGAINHSRLSTLVQHDGELEIQVSSFDAEGEGRFALQVWAESILQTP